MGITKWMNMPYILILVALINANHILANRLYSEGGSYFTQNNVQQPHQSVPQQSTTDAQSQEYFDTEYQDPNLYRTESSPAIEQERQRQRLASIVEQLRANSGQTPPMDIPNDDEPVLNPEEPHQRNRNAEELAELERLGTALRQMSEEDGNDFSLGDPEQPDVIAENGNGKKMEAVKKGQSEFVEFVEPGNNNRLKNIEWMEKRVPNDETYGRQHNGQGPFRLFATSGNLLFVAYLTICCVGVVAGTIGGVYYYNHVRTARVDDPFNEFTRYSPSGPGKDKFKKNCQQAFGQATGDDTLAYKAQLHHYQQQKQKILGTTGPVVSDTMSDNEEDTDELEHNFSVFECPGLAPTGDVEIQNPNFVGGDEKKLEKPE